MASHKWKKWWANRDVRIAIIAAAVVIVVVALAVWAIAVASRTNSDSSADVIDSYDECIAARGSRQESDQCITKSGVSFTKPSDTVADEEESSTDTTDEDESSTEPDKTFPDSSYMLVEQWGVKGPLDFDALGSVSYSINGEVLTLRSTELDQILPTPCEGVGAESWGVRRSTTEVTDKKIGDYYYAQIYPSAGCSVKKSQLDPINSAFRDFYDYLIAI